MPGKPPAHAAAGSTRIFPTRMCCLSVRMLPKFLKKRSNGVRIETMDLRIGAIVIANQMTLLSHNTVDYSRVPSPILQDWLVSEA